MTNKGFTLIETLVAVLILASAVAGPLTIAGKGLASATVAKNQTTAEFLAQDAIEYVRFVRDSNRLAGQNWLTDLGVCVSTDGATACYLDSLEQSPTVPTVCSGTCPAIRLNESTGSYRTDGAAGTSFVRTITIQTPVGTNDCVGTNGCEAIVKAEVFWRDNVNVAGGHRVTVVENIFNWQ